MDSPMMTLALVAEFRCRDGEELEWDVCVAGGSSPGHSGRTPVHGATRDRQEFP